MYNIIKERLVQGKRTLAYPAEPAPPLPSRFRGLPVLNEAKCPDGCAACVEACPTDAISRAPGALSLDMGRCLFCTDCTQACPTDAITFSQDYRLSARRREDLVVRSGKPFSLAPPLEPRMRRIFGRSFKLRQVSAAGDNSCEADLNVLGTVVFDMARFGIQFVASPRHADGVVITGPVSENMRLALLQTYEATPSPKLVIVVGSDAISGGIFRGHAEVHNGATDLLPVDLFIPGNPPHPMTILDGFLRLLGRIEESGLEPRQTMVARG